MCNLFIPFNLHKCSYISLIVFAHCVSRYQSSPSLSSLFPLLRTPHVSFSRWWWRWQRWSMWKLNFTSKINYAGMREAFALDGMCSSYEEIYVYLCANNKLQALANEEQWRVWELWKWIFDGYSPFRYFLFSCRLMLGIGGLNFILKLMRLFILGIFFFVFILWNGIRVKISDYCTPRHSYSTWSEVCEVAKEFGHHTADGRP